MRVDVVPLFVLSVEGEIGASGLMCSDMSSHSRRHVPLSQRSQVLHWLNEPHWVLPGLKQPLPLLICTHWFGGSQKLIFGGLLQQTVPGLTHACPVPPQLIGTFPPGQVWLTEGRDVERIMASAANVLANNVRIASSQVCSLIFPRCGSCPH